MAAKDKIKKRIDKDEDFIPPDGGWGWVICFASGATNIFMFPIFSYFGLIFQEQFNLYGVTASHTAIMINTHLGFAALSGFSYGPIFRNFTYRKVAIFGSILLISGIFFMSMTKSFPVLFIVYVFYLAIGKELIITAKQMAFNTYFKLKRRKALSIVSGLPSLANIGMPALITYLMYTYNTFGTLLILGAASGNVFVASLLYHPVNWHINKNIQMDEGIESNYKPKMEGSVVKEEDTDTKTNSQDYKNGEIKLGHTIDNRNENFISAIEEENTEMKLESNKLLSTASTSPVKSNKPGYSCFRKFSPCFDMDLIKDKSFLNICFGMSSIMLVQQNFKVLAPFFLKDFGFTNTQIALALSISQIPDLLTKILIPHILEIFKIKWKNRTLWIFCVSGMMIGEIIIAQNPSYLVLISVMFIEGVFSGAKSIFTGMLIPDHVSLNKMPAALGINRFISGVFMIGMGILIGEIRKNSNYTIMLVFLNLVSLLAIVLWAIEMWAKSSIKIINFSTSLI